MTASGIPWAHCEHQQTDECRPGRIIPSCYTKHHIHSWHSSVMPLSASLHLQLKRLLQLWFDFDSASIRLRHSYQNYDSTAIQLRFGFDSTTTSCREASEAIKKAVGWAYKDVIVYVTVIRMAFKLTDQHQVASFDCQRWYSPFTYFRCKKSSGMNSCLH